MYVSCSLTSKENLTTIHKQNITLDLEVYIISKYFYLMSIMNWTTLQLQRTEKIPSWHSKLINRLKQQKKPKKTTKIYENTNNSLKHYTERLRIDIRFKAKTHTKDKNKHIHNRSSVEIFLSIMYDWMFLNFVQWIE